MSSLLLRNALVVNEGTVTEADIFVQAGRINRIGTGLSPIADRVLDLQGRIHVFPGLIDDQVHFREPGLTHKGEIRTEARAAVAGGVTSYMEMPNTNPPTLTQELLEAKYQRAAEVSLANYSFFMGASNDNLEQVLRTDPHTVCGVKVFMGSSTGNMLVDDEKVLDSLFASTPMLIATHCEDETTIRANAAAARAQYGEAVPIDQHPIIRSAEACYLSSSRAVELARKHGTRLHVLHISTARELALFTPGPVAGKRITAEACIHHLWFCDKDYAHLGSHIKWNPAVKTDADRAAIWDALLADRIDVIATDHAPHTLEEKTRPYFDCPSGGPLVQHSLLALLDESALGRISLPWIAHKTAHAVADCFRIPDRGYIREGYWADFALVDLNTSTSVTQESILSKCGWSPFAGHLFRTRIAGTVVSGHLAYWQGQFDESRMGMRLGFGGV